MYYIAFSSTIVVGVRFFVGGYWFEAAILCDRG
jgi:hypothetical protein